MSLLAYLILKSPISKGELAAMVFCFTAVIFIATDKSSAEVVEDIVMNEAGVTGESVAELAKSGSAFIGMVLAFCAALSNASVGVLISKFQKIHWTVQLCHVTIFAITVALSRPLY